MRREESKEESKEEIQEIQEIQIRGYLIWVETCDVLSTYFISFTYVLWYYIKREYCIKQTKEDQLVR